MTYSEDLDELEEHYYSARAGDSRPGMEVRYTGGSGFITGISGRSVVAANRDPSWDAHRSAAVAEDTRSWTAFADGWPIRWGDPALIVRSDGSEHTESFAGGHVIDPSSRPDLWLGHHAGARVVGEFIRAESVPDVGWRVEWRVDPWAVPLMKRDDALSIAFEHLVQPREMNHRAGGRFHSTPQLVRIKHVALVERGAHHRARLAGVYEH